MLQTEDLISPRPPAKLTWFDVLSRRPVIALLSPSILLYVVLLAIPFAGLIVVGFFRTSDSGLFTPDFSVSNYARILTDKYYLWVAYDTIRISIETTVLCLLTGYPVAYLLSSISAKKRKVYLLLLLFPLLLSTVVRVYGWIVVLGRNGLLNQALMGNGFTTGPVGFLYHEWTVLLGLVSLLVPYLVINLTSCLMTIDPSYAEAATIHGSSPWKTFLKVTLPLSRPGILSGILVVFPIAMSTYLISILLGGPRVKLLGNVVFDASTSFNWPLGASVSVVLVLLTVASCVACLKILSTEKQRGNR